MVLVGLNNDPKKKTLSIGLRILASGIASN